MGEKVGLTIACGMTAFFVAVPLYFALTVRPTIPYPCAGVAITWIPFGLHLVLLGVGLWLAAKGRIAQVFLWLIIVYVVFVTLHFAVMNGAILHKACVVRGTWPPAF